MASSSRKSGVERSARRWQRLQGALQTTWKIPSPRGRIARGPSGRNNYRPCRATHLEGRPLGETSLAITVPSNESPTGTSLWIGDHQPPRSVHPVQAGKPLNREPSQRSTGSEDDPEEAPSRGDGRGSSQWPQLDDWKDGGRPGRTSRVRRSLNRADRVKGRESSCLEGRPRHSGPATGGDWNG